MLAARQTRRFLHSRRDVFLVYFASFMASLVLLLFISLCLVNLQKCPCFPTKPSKPKCNLTVLQRAEKPGGSAMHCIKPSIQGRNCTAACRQTKQPGDALHQAIHSSDGEQLEWFAKYVARLLGIRTWRKHRSRRTRRNWCKANSVTYTGTRN